MANGLFEIKNFSVLKHFLIVEFSNQTKILVNKKWFEQSLCSYGMLEIPVQLNDAREGVMNLELHFAAMTLEEYYEVGNVKSDLRNILMWNRTKNKITPSHFVSI